MTILSNTHCRWIVAVALALIGSSAGSAESDADLVDIAARIDYGYYAGDERVLVGARADLERLPAAPSARRYYLGYAAYRLSQLDPETGHRSRRELLAGCIDSARAALADTGWALEAWILIAACSLEGLDHERARALGHDLRLTEALKAARELGPEHPRLLLIEAWAQRRRDGDAARFRAQLDNARERFDAWQSRGIAPVWGRAEVLVGLAEAHLAHGQRREARDLIEQALIEAPGYHFALELKNRLSLPQ